MPKPSPIEIAFWETAKPLIPELEQEVWINKYRVDFLIPSKKIIIELYGYEYHNSKQKITKDAERERYLQSFGYQIIRFTGTEVFKDVKKCVNETIKLAKIEPAKIPIFNNTNPKIKENYIETTPKSRKPKMNKIQIATIGAMSIIAFSCGCAALSTVMNTIGR